MSHAPSPSPFSFGFDFFQNLTQAAPLPPMPNLANWAVPSLDIAELDKRINDLKTVHFWLDQNTKALAAAVQALEVQKMTLATLKGLNLNLAEIATPATGLIDPTQLWQSLTQQFTEIATAAMTAPPSAATAPAQASATTPASKEVKNAVSTPTASPKATRKTSPKTTPKGG